MQFMRAGAVILTALALLPGGAHVFELPKKIALPREQYFVVQQMYRGWALFGIVIIAALIANLGVAILAWRRREHWMPAALASLAIAASLAVFFAWVYPANVATQNWTQLPENWQTLRTQWEYGHVAGAGLIFLALCAAVVPRL